MVKNEQVEPKKIGKVFEANVQEKITLKDTKVYCHCFKDLSNVTDYRRCLQEVRSDVKLGRLVTICCCATTLFKPIFVDSKLVSCSNKNEQIILKRHSPIKVKNKIKLIIAHPCFGKTHYVKQFVEKGRSDLDRVIKKMYRIDRFELMDFDWLISWPKTEQQDLVGEDIFTMVKLDVIYHKVKNKHDVVVIGSTSVDLACKDGRFDIRLLALSDVEKLNSNIRLRIEKLNESSSHQNAREIDYVSIYRNFVSNRQKLKVLEGVDQLTFKQSELK